MVCGTLATLAGLKFVIVLFRSLFSKETMTGVIDAMGNKISEANEKITESVKKKAAERKKKKEDGRVIVTIR